MDFLGTKITTPSLVTPAATWWLEHGHFGMWVVRHMQPNKIVELGTHYGYSYFAMCEAVEQDNLSMNCIAVDTWQGDEHAGFYDDAVYQFVSKQNETYKRFSQLVRKTFTEALDDVEDGSVDLLHIDGRHFYEDVKEDFHLWQPKLSESAVVLFQHTQVRDANFGVYRFWAEVSSQRPSFNFTHGFGLGVLFWGHKIANQNLDFVGLIQDRKAQQDVRKIFETAAFNFRERLEREDKIEPRPLSAIEKFLRRFTQRNIK